MTVQEQYADFVKQSQEAVLTAVDTWTRTVQDALGQLPTLPAKVDPDAVIDQVYDFAGKLLAAQRDFARNLVHTSVTVAETIKQGAARAADPNLN
jgi:hypothetical protein